MTELQCWVRIKHLEVSTDHLNYLGLAEQPAFDLESLCCTTVSEYLKLFMGFYKYFTSLSLHNLNISTILFI